MKHLFEPEENQILYHYTTPEGAAAILQNNTLRLSEFSMMNDKSEYLYAKSKFVDAFQNRKVWIDDVPRLLASITLESHETETVMMIGCFTEECDDIGLWDRYAGGGTGCVLGLDANWLVEQAGIAARRVSYGDRHLQDFANAGFSMLQDQYEQNSDDTRLIVRLASLLVFDLYAFKDPRFQSEKEVRISRLTVADETKQFGLIDKGGHRSNGDNVAGVPIKQRQGPFGPVRFIDLPLWDENHKSAIRTVGFGPNTDSSQAIMVQKAASDISNISFWQSDAPLR